MTDTEALRNAVKRSGLKYIKIANEMGISSYTLQKKVNNKTEFKASEIMMLSSMLCLDDRERNSIFFA